jgi:fibronectin type III domain protein
MLRSLTLVSIVLAALSAAALPRFGEPLPLTDTSYVGVREYTSDFFAPAAPVLRSNGSDAFLFNFAEKRLQVARIVEGERRIPQLVFPFFVQGTIDFDAVWTGSHFLVVAKDQQDGYRMYGRLVDGTGTPVGEPFAIGDLTGTFPRLAFNGRNVLLLYSSLTMDSVVLTPDGRMTGTVPESVTERIVSEPAVVMSNGDRFVAILSTGDEGFDDLYTFDGNGHVSSQRQVESVGRVWAIATDGERFLAVNAQAGNARAQLLGADGTTLASLTLDTESHFHRNPLVAWAGSRWVISTVASNTGRVVEVDKTAHEILSTQTFPNTQVGLVARRGKVLALWWSDKELLAHEFPVGTESGKVVGQQAAPQDLLATASSANATLIVWYEDEFRMGVRTHDGRWTERRLDAVPTQTLLAASNGNGFVVIVDTEAIHLDEAGNVLWRGTVPLLPFAIAWNGTHYGLFGINGGQVVSSVLTTAASTPVVLPIERDEALGLTLAPSGNPGNGFLAAWASSSGFCPETPCAPTNLHALLLDAEMRPSGSVLSLVAETELVSYAVRWSGDRYIVAYTGIGRIHTLEVTSGGSVGNPRLIADEGADGSSAVGVNVVPQSDGVAIGWIAARAFDHFVARGVSIDRNGVVSAPVTIHDDAHLGSGFRSVLFALGDGRLAYLFSSANNDAPHHGARRVMLSLTDAILPELPDPPSATLEKTVAGATLSWTRPGGAVDGYRVERRTGDDAWMEVGGALDDAQHELPVTLPARRITAFRVRAVNDAGPGPYSLPVSLEPGKRRAVR